MKSLCSKQAKFCVTTYKDPWSSCKLWKYDKPITDPSFHDQLSCQVKQCGCQTHTNTHVFIKWYIGFSWVNGLHWGPENRNVCIKVKTYVIKCKQQQWLANWIRRVCQPVTVWELGRRVTPDAGHHHTSRWPITASSWQDVRMAMTREYVSPSHSMVPSLQLLTGRLDLSM